MLWSDEPRGGSIIQLLKYVVIEEETRTLSKILVPLVGLSTKQVRSKLFNRKLSL